MRHRRKPRKQVMPAVGQSRANRSSANWAETSISNGGGWLTDVIAGDPIARPSPNIFAN